MGSLLPSPALSGLGCWDTGSEAHGAGPRAASFIKSVFPPPFCASICIHHHVGQYLFSKVVLFKQGVSLLNSSTPISCGPRPSKELTLIICMTARSVATASGRQQPQGQAPPYFPDSSSWGGVRDRAPHLHPAPHGWAAQGPGWDLRPSAQTGSASSTGPTGLVGLSVKWDTTHASPWHELKCRGWPWAVTVLVVTGGTPMHGAGTRGCSMGVVPPLPFPLQDFPQGRCSGLCPQGRRGARTLGVPHPLPEGEP